HRDHPAGGLADPDAGGHQAVGCRQGTELARRDAAGPARDPAGDEVGRGVECRAGGHLMNLPSTSSLATDTHSIDALRLRASTDPKAAIKEAARQFESLFMQELMKSMRAAQESMSAGMLDNAGSEM